MGNNKKKDLIHILEEHMGEKESAAESIEVIDIAHDQEYESLHVEQLKEHTRAYIKVQDGCNQFCSYCIIPYARGRVRSRKMEEVLEEITNLTKHGCQEFCDHRNSCYIVWKRFGRCYADRSVRRDRQDPGSKENPFGISGTWIYHKGYIGSPF